MFFKFMGRTATADDKLDDELIGAWWDSGTASFDPEFKRHINEARRSKDPGLERVPNTQSLDELIRSRAESLSA